MGGFSLGMSIVQATFRNHILDARPSALFIGNIRFASWDLLPGNALGLAEHPFQFLGPGVGAIDFGHAAQIPEQAVGSDFGGIGAGGTDHSCSWTSLVPGTR